MFESAVLNGSLLFTETEICYKEDSGINVLYLY